MHMQGAARDASKGHILGIIFSLCYRLEKEKDGVFNLQRFYLQFRPISSPFPIFKFCIEMFFVS